MEKIFDKLGVYDFWGTFFPGLVGLLVIDLCFFDLNSYIDNFKVGYELVVFVTFSYLLGIVLHEIGHFIQENILYSEGEPCDIFLLNGNVFSKDETEIHLKLYKTWARKNEVDVIPDSFKCRMFFNYCDYFISDNVKASKMQSIYGMSRSLMVLSGLVVLFGVIRFKWIICVNSIVSLLIFTYRTKRFNEIRLKVVMRTYFVEQKDKYD